MSKKIRLKGEEAEEDGEEEEEEEEDDDQEAVGEEEDEDEEMEETFQLRQCGSHKSPNDAFKALRPGRTRARDGAGSSLKKASNKAGKKKPKMTDERGHWSGKLDFILSLLGYSIGLGNVWRFPYLCYKNGGGAFLIPFIVMVLIAGLPLMFMELALGQYSNMSPVILFDKFCPLFSGLGYAMVLISFVVMLYYNMILAWTLYYMWVSIGSDVPWKTCDPAWATDSCFSLKHLACLKKSRDHVFSNGTCFNQTMAEQLGLSEPNVTIHRTTGSEYFERGALRATAGIEETDWIRPQMAISLLAAWIIVYLCLIKGVQSSGKVVYFTALFPFFLLVILFFRGITLPGAMDGIVFYITPQFDQLFSMQVWNDAAVQIFFALSPAWGGLITLSSYNRFNNNCFRDALIVSFANILTSIFAGFAVFSVIGYLAGIADTEVSKVVDQGVGLAFKVYPEVVNKLPFAPFWSFLFFFMLFTLGLDSQFALLETVQTAILDRNPALRSRKELTLLVVCAVAFTFGLLFTTGSGVYWLQLVDYYASSFCVLILALIESCIVAWVYGADKFLTDIDRMIGTQSKLFKVYWSLNWKYFSPLSLIFIIVFSWIKATALKIGDYEYPYWANVFGWNLSFMPIYVLIAMISYHYIRSDLDLSHYMKIWILMQPKESWHLLHRNYPDGRSGFPNGLIIATSSDANMLSNELNNNFLTSSQSNRQPKTTTTTASNSLSPPAQTSFDNPTFDTRF